MYHSRDNESIKAEYIIIKNFFISNHNLKKFNKKVQNL